MKNLFGLLAVAGMALVCSCQNDDVTVGMESSARSETIKVKLSCDLLDTETDGTRSTHDMAALRRISNANYYLFSGGSLVKQEYFDDADDFAVSLSSYNRKYNLYVLANVGEKTVGANVCEADMRTAVHHDYMNKDNYYDTIEEYGFPMALIVRDFSATCGGSLKLKRLVHTLYVKVNTDALNTTEMEFTGLNIRNAARDVYPFAEESKARYVMDGDAANLDSGELQALNDGEEVTLFLLENMRGELFPGNSDWKMKVPAEMVPESEKSMCSYIELTTSAQTATAYYEQNVYRAYIGSSAADCDVRRHAYSTLNNLYTNDMIVDEEWRIESDDPVITETLAFIDNHELMGSDMKELSRIYVMPGFTTEFYIYKSNPDIQYSLTAPTSSEDGRISCTAVEISPYFTKVTLTTSLDWNEQTDNHAGVLRLVSSDGLISKTLNAVVWNRPLSLTFSTEFSNSRPVLCMTLNDPPLDMTIRARMKGDIGGYLSHYPNGYKRDESTVTLSKSFSYENSNETMCENTSYYDAGENTTAGIFQMGTKINSLIWNETGWDSLNKYNDNDGYDKHAHPTSINLNIDLSCSWQNRTSMYHDDNFIIYPTAGTAGIPLQINNEQYSKTVSNSGTAIYKGGGTDFGMIWTQHDKEGDDGYDIAFDAAKGQTGNVIHVTVNGISNWTDNFPYVTISK